MTGHIKVHMETKSISDFRTNLNSRNRIEKFFVTFPQWDCSDENIRQTILENFPPYKFAISCVESHKDGGKHLHVIIGLEISKTPATFRQWVLPNFSEIEQNKIHIGSTKSLKSCLEYINKEDLFVYTVGNVPHPNARKKGYTKKILKIKFLRSNSIHTNHSSKK